MTHDLSVLFPKRKSVQQTLRKNWILDIWSTTLCLLYLMKHCGQPRLSLYTPNVHFKVFFEMDLEIESFEVVEIIKNLNSVLVFKIELLLSRAETFYWQKTKYLGRVKKLLSKKKSNFCLSTPKLGEDITAHHLQQINQLITRVIRGLLHVFSESDSDLLGIYETGLLEVSSLDFNKSFTFREYNRVLAPLGVVFDSKTLVHFPLNTREFVGMLFAGNKHAVMSLSSGASNTVTYNVPSTENQASVFDQNPSKTKGAQLQSKKNLRQVPKTKIHVTQAMKKEHITKKANPNQKIKDNLINLIQDNTKESLWDQHEEDFSRPQPPFLGPKTGTQKFSLILDMDETMIHYPEDILIRQELVNDSEYDKFLVRPFLKDFLLQLYEEYEIIVFTSASQNYADFILNKVERLYGKSGFPL